MPDNEFFETEKKIEESDGFEPSATPFTQPFQNTQNPIIYNNPYGNYIPYGFTPKTYMEKRKIKTASKAAGLAFIVLNTAIIVISFALAFIFGLAESIFALSEPLMSDPAVVQAMQIFLSITVFTLPFILVYKSYGYRISSLMSFKKPLKGTSLPFFLFGIGFCAFANIATSIAASIIESFGINYDVGEMPQPQGIYGLALVIISTVVVPAFVEEFACRGVVLGSLRKFGDNFAIIVSALLFGLMHGNFSQMPFAFLVGLILGFVTVKSGSMWIAIAIHAFNNGMSVVFEYLFKYLTLEEKNVVYIAFLCVSMLLGILGLGILKTRESYTIEPSKTESSEKQKYKWFFGSLFIIIFIIICLIESMAFFV